MKELQHTLEAVFARWPKTLDGMFSNQKIVCVRQFHTLQQVQTGSTSFMHCRSCLFYEPQTLCFGPCSLDSILMLGAMRFKDVRIVFIVFRVQGPKVFLNLLQLGRIE